MICTCGTNNLPFSTTSDCTNQIDCICGLTYLGRSTQWLSECVPEQIPTRLDVGPVSINTSAIYQHLWDTGHHVDRKISYEPIYRLTAKQWKSHKQQILSTLVAAAIWLLKPGLCAQKTHIRITSGAFDAVHDSSNWTDLICLNNRTTLHNHYWSFLYKGLLTWSEP